MGGGERAAQPRLPAQVAGYGGGRDARVPQLVTRDEDPLELVGGEIDPRQTGAAEIDFNQLARLK